MTPSPSTPPGYFRLFAIQVRGAYFDGLDAPLAPHTTCFIGGKGSGKSTAVEYIRFCFNLPLHPSTHDVRALVKRNLGTGTVRIPFETPHGVRGYAERALKDERPRFYTEDGQPMSLAPEACLIDFYGQDEIESVGGDRASQLALLERLAGDDLRPIATELAQVTDRLREGAKELLTLEKEIAALESDASEARAIDDQLKPLLAASGTDGALLATAHTAKGARSREAHTMKTASAVLAEVRGQVETAVAQTRRKLSAVVPGDVRESPNADLFARVNQELAAVAGALEELVTGAARRIDAATATVSGLHDKLAALHAKDDGAYDALLARQKEDHARSGERARLQERHAVVARALPVLEERVRHHADLRRAQDALADRLVVLRDQRAAVLARAATALNAEFEPQGVKIAVHEAQQLDAYRAYLRDVFRPITGDQPKWLVDKVSRLRPDELVAIVRAQDIARLIERAEMKRNPERAAQAIAALTPNEHLYALQSVAIDDTAVLFLKHGTEWKDTVECSPGQRCGAVLPLLLSNRWAVLAIDQPDDNVEPDFMCNVVLPKIAQLKGVRQFIFVTHHANVPVLSLAEEIVFIESNGRSAHLEAHGDVKKMKSWVLGKLEGGARAFEARRKLYEENENEAGE